MNGALAQILTVFSMIVGVAIISVLVSKNADTSNIVTSTFSGFSKALGAAEAPVTGTGGSNILSGVFSNTNSF